MYSKRCKLQLISKNDFNHIKQLYENEEVRKYLGGIINEEAYKHRFFDMLNSKNSNLHWTVFLKDSKEFIGIVFLDTYHDGINTEIGYQFLPKFWGRGLASEVIEEVLNYGFNFLSLTTIVAETQSRNKASCGLLKKVGMTFEETIERFGNQQSKFSMSTVNYSILIK